MKGKRIILGSGLLALIQLTAPSAHAWGGPLASAVYVHCAMPLDHFPQPVKTTNTSSCFGGATGAFSGLQSNAPGGEVTAVSTYNFFQATAQVYEPCVNGLLGFSNGTATFGAEVFNVTKGLSTYLGPGVYTTGYSWSRVGATAVITTGKLNPLVDAKKGSLATLTWAKGTATDYIGGLGLAVFTPFDVPRTDDNFVVSCPGPKFNFVVDAVIGSV